MTTLIEKLLEVQQELSHAKAESVNPHFKSSYVNFENLWDYCQGGFEWARHNDPANKP